MLKKIYITILAIINQLPAVKRIPGCRSVRQINTVPITIRHRVNDLQSILAPCYSNLRDPGLFGFNFMPKALSNSMHVVNSAYNGDQAWNEMANT